MSQINQLKQLLQGRNTDAINAFIKKTPTVLNEVDEKGLSGLMYIAYYQLTDCIPTVLAVKSDFTIYEACALGLLNHVITKVNTQPNLLHTSAKDGFYPLTLACYFGKKDIAAYLLKKGAKVNAPATNGSKVTPLHSAIARNDLDICQLLLANGADVNAKQMQDVTALHSAAHRGNLAMVKCLVENEADTSAKTVDGLTALDYAKNDGHKTVEAFLSKN